MNDGFVSPRKAGTTGSPSENETTRSKKSLAPVLFQIPHLRIPDANHEPVERDNRPLLDSHGTASLTAPAVPPIGNFDFTQNEVTETNDFLRNNDQEKTDDDRSPGIGEDPMVDVEPKNENRDNESNSREVWWQSAKSLLSIVAGVLLVLFVHSMLTSKTEEPKLTADGSSTWSQSESQQTAPSFGASKSDTHLEADTFQPPSFELDAEQPATAVADATASELTASNQLASESRVAAKQGADAAQNASAQTSLQTTRPLEPMSPTPQRQFDPTQVAQRANGTAAANPWTNNTPTQASLAAQASDDQNGFQSSLQLQPPSNTAAMGTTAPEYPHTDPRTYKYPPGYFPLESHDGAAASSGRTDTIYEDTQSPLPSAARWDRTTNPNQF